MFPLRAGVIVNRVPIATKRQSVSPACGGLSALCRAHRSRWIVFPLRAGVIGKKRVGKESGLSVSLACGGYRDDLEMLTRYSLFFPCVRGLSEMTPIDTSARTVFPLRAGVIGNQRQGRRNHYSVSPACGGYLGYIERVTGK